MYIFNKNKILKKNKVCKIRLIDYSYDTYIFRKTLNKYENSS